MAPRFSKHQNKPSQVETDKGFTKKNMLSGIVKYLLNDQGANLPEWFLTALSKGDVEHSQAQSFLDLAERLFNALMAKHDLREHAEDEGPQGRFHFDNAKVRENPRRESLNLMGVLNNLGRRLTTFETAEVTKNTSTLLKWEAARAEAARRAASKPKEFKPAPPPAVNVWGTMHPLREKAEKLSEASSETASVDDIFQNLQPLEEDDSSTTTESTGTTTAPHPEDDFVPVRTGESLRRALKKAQAKTADRIKLGYGQLPFALLGAVKTKHEVDGIVPNKVFAIACKQWVFSLAEGYTRYTDDKAAEEFALEHAKQKMGL